MLDVALEQPPETLTDIVVPDRVPAFPPFRPSAVIVEPAALQEEGWSFADSFELAMLAVCLAGASFLAAGLFGADQVTGQLVSQPSARQAGTILTVLASLSILVGVVFTVEGLFRLRALTRYLDQADPIMCPGNATQGCADAAVPGARTGRSLARSRAWARRQTPGS